MLVVYCILGFVIQTTLLVNADVKVTEISLEQNNSFDPNYDIDCPIGSAPRNATNEEKIKHFQTAHCPWRCFFRRFQPIISKMPSEDRDKLFAEIIEPTPFVQDVCGDNIQLNMDNAKHAICIGTIIGDESKLCRRWIYGWQKKVKNVQTEDYVLMLCSSLRGFYRCLMNFVRDSCGYEAEAFIRRFLKDVLSNTVKTECGDLIGVRQPDYVASMYLDSAQGYF